MDRISIHNRNYKVRPEVRQHIEQLQKENELSKKLHAEKCDAYMLIETERLKLQKENEKLKNAFGLVQTAANIYKKLYEDKELEG